MKQMCILFIYLATNFNHQPINSDALEGGYPKPHPTERCRWKGFAWVCLFATHSIACMHKGPPRIHASVNSNVGKENFEGVKKGHL